MSFRSLILAAALAGVATGAAPAPGWAPALPDGVQIGPGVTHVVVERAGLHADVAVLGSGAPVELRVVVAGNRVGDGVERTSAMCARVECLVAVNGDFRLPGTNRPVGGVVHEGVLLKSPSPDHHQLSSGGAGELAAGPMALRANLVTTDLETVEIGAVNDERREGALVLYTSAFGRSTGTNAHGTEVALRLHDPESRLALGQTAVAEIVGISPSTGDTAIPEDGAVLSGHGAAAARLDVLEARLEAGDIGRRVLLRLESEPSATESVGGTPLILRDGRRWFADDGSDFVRGRHPRTAVGWDGERVFLVTVDGRQPGHSEGMSLPELADFLLELGATDAINLDGGGTTTFVVAGEVVNSPSDRLVERGGSRRIVPAPGAADVVLGSVERPSTTALAVVVRGAGVRAVDPLSGAGLDLPTVDLRPPTASDPASVPGGHLPALVGSTATRSLDARLAVVAVAALTLASLAVGFSRRSRLDHPAT